jgi:hypothetical protein
MRAVIRAISGINWLGRYARTAWVKAEHFGEGKKTSSAASGRSTAANYNESLTTSGWYLAIRSASPRAMLEIRPCSSTSSGASYSG